MALGHIVRNFNVQKGSPYCPIRKWATRGERRESRAIARAAGAIIGSNKTDATSEPTRSRGRIKPHILLSFTFRKLCTAVIAERGDMA
jgi:hypothetical protein